jgi:hypothetical protein
VMQALLAANSMQTPQPFMINNRTAQPLRCTKIFLALQLQ